jgi:hypothetical protein
MALIFPALSGGFTAKYPLKRTHKHRSTVYVHGDFTEQRFAKGTQLDEFELHFTSIPTADKNKIEAFFSSVRGQFDTTWQIYIDDIDGVAKIYHHMQFMDPTFTAVENDEGFWTFTLRMRQTRKE